MVPCACLEARQPPRSQWGLPRQGPWGPSGGLGATHDVRYPMTPKPHYSDRGAYQRVHRHQSPAASWHHQSCFAELYRRHIKKPITQRVLAPTHQQRTLVTSCPCGNACPHTGAQAGAQQCWTRMSQNQSVPLNLNAPVATPAPTGAQAGAGARAGAGAGARAPLPRHVQEVRLGAVIPLWLGRYLAHWERLLTRHARGASGALGPIHPLPRHVQVVRVKWGLAREYYSDEQQCAARNRVWLLGQPGGAVAGAPGAALHQECEERESPLSVAPRGRCSVHRYLDIYKKVMGRRTSRTGATAGGHRCPTSPHSKAQDAT